MSTISFYLQADEAANDEISFREYYSFRPGERKDSSGEMVQDIKIGHVDEAIIAAHPKDYAAFHGYVEANKSELYAAAKLNLGQPVYVDGPIEINAAALPEKAKKAKKKGVIE